MTEIQQQLTEARAILHELLEKYRNARDAISLTAELPVMTAMQESVRALEAIDRLLVRSIVNLKREGSQHARD